MVLVGSGWRGYKECYKSGSGAIVYTLPIKSDLEHYHIQLNGDSCACLTPADLGGIEEIRRGGLKVTYKRVDLAFDTELFTVEEYLEQVKADNITRRSSRECLEVMESPFKLREDGRKGTMTVYLGSASSDRRLRVYNLHGPTRVELQLRGDWAGSGWCLSAGRSLFKVV